MWFIGRECTTASPSGHGCHRRERYRLLYAPVENGSRYALCVTDLSNLYPCRDPNEGPAPSLGLFPVPDDPSDDELDALGPIADDGTVVRIPLKRSRTKIDLPEGMKRCPACERVLTIDNFGSHVGKSDGLASRCRECARAATAAWRETRRNAQHSEPSDG